MRVIKARTSLSSNGRPTSFVRDLQRHHSRKLRWCQRTTVCGWTTTSAERQPAYNHDRAIQKSRSHRRSRGRGRCRLRTANCWRRARFSRTSWLRGSRSRRRTQPITRSCFMRWDGMWRREHSSVCGSGTSCHPRTGLQVMADGKADLFVGCWPGYVGRMDCRDCPARPRHLRAYEGQCPSGRVVSRAIPEGENVARYVNPFEEKFCEDTISTNGLPSRASARVR